MSTKKLLIFLMRIVKVRIKKFGDTLGRISRHTSAGKGLTQSYTIYLFFYLI